MSDSLEVYECNHCAGEVSVVEAVWFNIDRVAGGQYVPTRSTLNRPGAPYCSERCAELEAMQSFCQETP